LEIKPDEEEKTGDRAPEDLPEIIHKTPDTRKSEEGEDLQLKKKALLSEDDIPQVDNLSKTHQETDSTVTDVQEDSKTLLQN